MFKRTTAGDVEDPAVRSRMPKAGAPVTVTRTGGPTVAGTVGGLEGRTFTIKTALKGKAGVSYFVNFQTHSSRHRFHSRCIEVTPDGMVLAYPAKIESLGGAPQKSAPSAGSGRQAVRLETAIRCEWRVAKSAQGGTPFVRGSLIDISRTGGSLICEHELTLGWEIELRVVFGAGAAQLILPAVVRRAARAGQPGKWVHGLSFEGLSQEHERAITHYINHRQTEARKRGLI